MWYNKIGIGSKIKEDTTKEQEVQALREEITYIKNRQKSMEYILRWVVLIPAVFIVDKLASALVSFVYEHFWVHNSYLDVSRDIPWLGQWFVFYFKMWLLEWISVVVTLGSACYIAPTHRKWVFGIYTIWLIFSAYLTVHWGNTEYDFTLFQSILSYLVVTLGLFPAIGFCYFHFKEELQSGK